jgi:putative transposase
MTPRRRKKHKPEQIVAKLRDADARPSAGMDLGAELQALEISEATLVRWRAQFGGMKSEEAKRLKALESALLCLPRKGGVGRAVAPILPAQRTARLCAAILDRRDTVPTPPFSTAVNNRMRLQGVAVE